MDRERRVQDYLIALYHYDDLSTEELWLGEHDLGPVVKCHAHIRSDARVTAAS
ncbi:hypothetical protein [Streptomyces sp. NPDC056169]|uniref:hypothetical protein n=1 Tax=Streptomyces sp. NPDC056169 TaxID=3345734 RepID=UPI0035D8306E